MKTNQEKLDDIIHSIKKKEKKRKSRNKGNKKKGEEGIFSTLFSIVLLTVFVLLIIVIYFYIRKQIKIESLGVNNLDAKGNINADGYIIAKNDITTDTDMQCDTLFCDNLSQGSDIRIKENIQSLENTYSKLLELKSLTYNLKHDKDKKKKYGFIAQEVEKIFPELISRFDTKNIENQLHIDYVSMIPLIVEALQIQNNMINEIKNNL